MSAELSASGLVGGHRFTRVRLAPYTRAAIQVAVAAGIAVTVGDVRSGTHFYWALLAVFIIFMGTSNAGEQVNKGLLRVLRTLVGISVGDGLAHAVGPHHPDWTIIVVLVSMFFAISLMKVSSFT